MYSVVLMAALTTSVDLPDRGGCRGGCYGGCFGRRGGCRGGCWGGGWGYGCCGCYGGGWGYGCMGYGGCYGGGWGYGCYGGGVMPYTIQPSGEKIKKKPAEKSKETLAPAPATIVVELPADAKLLIDNEATTSTGSSRVFQSPDLDPGKAYHYTLKAEVIRDGKPIRVEKVVDVKAGKIAPVTLTLPTASVAQR